MVSKLFLLTISLLFPVITVAQEISPFRVVFWNTENLFDTHHDSLKLDEEFLPSSYRGWHYGRYRKKLADVSRVITALGEWASPALVGFCEVENDNVMRDLTKYSPLKEHGYQYVMTDSPDRRGIDVALLYQRDRFKLLGYQFLRIYPESPGHFPTRDILHVTGQLLTGDSLDVFVCHFPSRSSGEKETEPYRLLVARTLKNTVDSLFAVRYCPQVIIMGDLNDYPYNKSVATVLTATFPPSQHPERNGLYHVLARKANQSNYGSCKYQGEWGLLDHIIVSGSLLDSGNTFHTDEGKAHVARLPFLLMKDEKYGGQQPFRTYSGMKYQGGFSDHLPVYVDIMENSF
jgi:endonuclease/exonuclease/phosphatase family metal-dependent hydrolase